MARSSLVCSIWQRYDFIPNIRCYQPEKSADPRYLCGGSCVEDVTSHLLRHLSHHPLLRSCSSDTILRIMDELKQENTTYTSETGKQYDFNTADELNDLLLDILVSTGQLVQGEKYDFDFDHEFLETE